MVSGLVAPAVPCATLGVGSRPLDSASYNWNYDLSGHCYSSLKISCISPADSTFYMFLWSLQLGFLGQENMNVSVGSVLHELLASQTGT